MFFKGLVPITSIAAGHVAVFYHPSLLAGAHAAFCLISRAGPERSSSAACVEL